MGGVADQLVRPQQATRRRHRQIVLAQMHTRRLAELRYVGAVIDDERNFRRKKGAQLLHFGEQCPAACLLGAQLDKTNPRPGEDASNLLK